MKLQNALSQRIAKLKSIANNLPSEGVSFTPYSFRTYAVIAYLFTFQSVFNDCMLTKRANFGEMRKSCTISLKKPRQLLIDGAFLLLDKKKYLNYIKARLSLAR